MNYMGSNNMNKITPKQVNKTWQEWDTLNEVIYSKGGITSNDIDHKELTELLFSEKEFSISVLMLIARYFKDSIKLNNSKVKHLIEHVSPKIVLPENTDELIESIAKWSILYEYPNVLSYYLTLIDEDLIDKLKENGLINRMMCHMRDLDEHSLKNITTVLKMKFSRESVIYDRCNNTKIERSAWKYINTKEEEIAYNINNIKDDSPKNRADDIKRMLKTVKIEDYHKVAVNLKRHSDYRVLIELAKE